MMQAIETIEDTEIAKSIEKNDFVPFVKKFFSEPQ